MSLGANDQRILNLIEVGANCEICGYPINEHVISFSQIEKRYDYRGRCPWKNPPIAQNNPNVQPGAKDQLAKKEKNQRINKRKHYPNVQQKEAIK